MHPHDFVIFRLVPEDIMKAVSDQILESEAVPDDFVFNEDRCPGRKE